MKRVVKIAGVCILVALVFLYPLSYVFGRLTGIGGVVVDNTTSISFERNGEVTAAMGGGFLPMKRAGRGGVFLRNLNTLFVPARKLDYILTEEQFYWFFYDTE